MIHELLNVGNDESFPEMCARLGRFLELEEPVAENVLVRAIEDPAFASDLIICRKAPAFLAVHLNDPRNADYRRFAGAGGGGHTNLQLVRKATRAFVDWGKAGFSVVDDETLARRERACLSCPHLVEPQKTLQKVFGKKEDAGRLGRRTGKRVCELCGCNAGKKMHLPSEHCPGRHPALAGKTRWGEPLPEPAPRQADVSGEVRSG